MSSAYLVRLAPNVPARSANEASILLKHRFESDGLVGAPCGSTPSRVVSEVNNRAEGSLYPICEKAAFTNLAGVVEKKS
jgi:hypothetical protein